MSKKQHLNCYQRNPIIAMVPSLKYKAFRELRDVHFSRIQTKHGLTEEQLELAQLLEEIKAMKKPSNRVFDWVYIHKKASVKLMAYINEKRKNVTFDRDAMRHLVGDSRRKAFADYRLELRQAIEAKANRSSLTIPQGPGGTVPAKPSGWSAASSVTVPVANSGIAGTGVGVAAMPLPAPSSGASSSESSVSSSVDSRGTQPRKMGGKQRKRKTTQDLLVYDHHEKKAASDELLKKSAATTTTTTTTTTGMKKKRRRKSKQSIDATQIGVTTLLNHQLLQGGGSPKKALKKFPPVYAVRSRPKSPPDGEEQLSDELVELAQLLDQGVVSRVSGSEIDWDVISERASPRLRIYLHERRQLETFQVDPIGCLVPPTKMYAFQAYRRQLEGNSDYSSMGSNYPSGAQVHTDRWSFSTVSSLGDTAAASLQDNQQDRRVSTLAVPLEKRAADAVALYAAARAAMQSQSPPQSQSHPREAKRDDNTERFDPVVRTGRPYAAKAPPDSTDAMDVDIETPFAHSEDVPRQATADETTPDKQEKTDSNESELLSPTENNETAGMALSRRPSRRKIPLHLSEDLKELAVQWELTAMASKDGRTPDWAVIIRRASRRLRAMIKSRMKTRQFQDDPAVILVPAWARTDFAILRSRVRMNPQDFEKDIAKHVASVSSDDGMTEHDNEAGSDAVVGSDDSDDDVDDDEAHLASKPDAGSMPFGHLTHDEDEKRQPRHSQNAAGSAARPATYRPMGGLKHDEDAPQLVVPPELSNVQRELAELLVLARVQRKTWNYIESKASADLRRYIDEKATNPEYLEAPLRFLVPRNITIPFHSYCAEITKADATVPPRRAQRSDSGSQ